MASSSAVPPRGTNVSFVRYGASAIGTFHKQSETRDQTDTVSLYHPVHAGNPEMHSFHQLYLGDSPPSTLNDQAEKRAPFVT